MTESADRQFGPYRLVHQIATGGMAEIHLAKTKGVGGFEKYVALKMIHPNFSSDEHFIQMLIDEAKISVQLQHVNIAQIFDLGRVEDTYYIAMEYVDGCDLFRILRRASEKDVPMPIEIAAYVAKEVAAGLDYAHRKRDTQGRPMGIVHRDISPQNVLLSTAGEVKIVDFGIAKASMRARQTAAGVIKGKYYYMSPEQAWGDAVDARSDIFSAGILLYEMLTGQMLYLEEDMTKLLDLVRKANIPPPSTKRKDVPRDLDRIVMRALAKKADLRWQSAHDFGGALERFLNQTAPDFTSARLAAFVASVLSDKEKADKEKADKDRADKSDKDKLEKGKSSDKIEKVNLPLRAPSANVGPGPAVVPAPAASAPKPFHDARRVTRGMGRDVIMSRNEFADENSIIFSGPKEREAVREKEKPARPATAREAGPLNKLIPKGIISPSASPGEPVAPRPLRLTGPQATFGPAAEKKPLLAPSKLVTPAGKPAAPLRKALLDTPHATLPPEGEDRTFVSSPPAFGAPDATIDVAEGALLPADDPAASVDRSVDRSVDQTSDLEIPAPPGLKPVARPALPLVARPEPSEKADKADKTVVDKPPEKPAAKAPLAPTKPLTPAAKAPEKPIERALEAAVPQPVAKEILGELEDKTAVQAEPGAPAARERPPSEDKTLVQAPPTAPEPAPVVATPPVVTPPPVVESPAPAPAREDYDPLAARVTAPASGTETVRRVTSRPPPTPTRQLPPPAPRQPGARPAPVEAELPSVMADDLLTEVQEGPGQVPIAPFMPVDRSGDRSGDRSVDRSGDRSVDRSGDRSVDRALEPPPRPPVAPSRPPPGIYEDDEAQAPWEAPRQPARRPATVPQAIEDNGPIEDGAVDAGWAAPQQDISMKYKISHRASPRSERRWFGLVLFLVAGLVAAAVVWVAMNSGAPAAPEVGALEVISIPPGGKLTVDGQPRGVTPQVLDELRLGTSVKLHVEMDRYEPWQRVETLSAAHTVRVVASLKPIMGTLRVLSQPPGAEVFFDNRSLGVTPLEKDVDPFTDGVIEVRKAGFKPSRQPLTWGGKREALLNFTLLPGRD